MQITIEQTSMEVEMVKDGVTITAGVWQGKTSNGTSVTCFVTDIVSQIPKSDPHRDELCAEFQRELGQYAKPWPSVQGVLQQLCKEPDARDGWPQGSPPFPFRMLPEKTSSE
jgi:hypothetical protein